MFTWVLLKHITALCECVFNLYWLLFMSEIAAEVLLYVIVFSVRCCFKIVLEEGCGIVILLGWPSSGDRFWLYHWSKLSRRPSLDSVGLLSLEQHVIVCMCRTSSASASDLWVSVIRSGSRLGDDRLAAEQNQIEIFNNMTNFSLLFVISWLSHWLTNRMVKEWGGEVWSSQAACCLASLACPLKKIVNHRTLKPVIRGTPIYLPTPRISKAGRPVSLEGAGLSLTFGSALSTVLTHKTQTH